MWNQIRLRRADSESSLSPGDANATEFQMRTSVSVPVFSPSCWAMNTISFQPGYGLALVSNFRISLESLTSWFSMCALFSPSVREWNKGPNKHKQNQTQFIIFNQRGSQTQARGSPGARQETNKTNKQTNKNNCWWLGLHKAKTIKICWWEKTQQSHLLLISFDRYCSPCPLSSFQLQFFSGPCRGWSLGLLTR